MICIYLHAVTVAVNKFPEMCKHLTQYQMLMCMLASVVLIYHQLHQIHYQWDSKSPGTMSSIAITFTREYIIKTHINTKPIEFVIKSSCTKNCTAFWSVIPLATWIITFPSTKKHQKFRFLPSLLLPHILSININSLRSKFSPSLLSQFAMVLHGT